MLGGLARQLGGGAAPARWLLVVAVLALLLSAPAFAQELTTPDKLANGTVTYVLSVACCALAVCVVYLFRELRKESAARIEDLARSNELALKLQESAVKLSIEALEAVEVVERVVDRFPSPAAPRG